MRNGWESRPDLAPKLPRELLDVFINVYTKGDCRLLFSPRESHGLGQIWAHASISCENRYPTWDEILDARYTFFDEKAEVVQVMPPRSEYINLHPNCFHLWSPCPAGKRVTPQ